jgi:hypothetical protein
VFLQTGFHSSDRESSVQESLIRSGSKIKLNSVALVRERTIPTEGRRRSAKLVPTFAGRGVSRGQRNGSPRPLISVF